MFITNLFDLRFLHYFYPGTSEFNVDTGPGMPGCSYATVMISLYVQIWPFFMSIFLGLYWKHARVLTTDDEEKWWWRGDVVGMKTLNALQNAAIFIVGGCFTFLMMLNLWEFQLSQVQMYTYKPRQVHLPWECVQESQRNFQTTDPRKQSIYEPWGTSNIILDR